MPGTHSLFAERLVAQIGFLKWAEVRGLCLSLMGGVERVFISPDVNSLHVAAMLRGGMVEHHLFDYSMIEERRDRWANFAELLEELVVDESELQDVHEPGELVVPDDLDGWDGQSRNIAADQMMMAPTVLLQGGKQ